MLATLGVIVVVILGFTVYVGRNVGTTAGATPTPSPSVNGRKTYTSPPPMTINTAHVYLATITTNKGTITLRLDPKLAPITVNNFVFLARNKFYDGLKFHRVVPGFVVQGRRQQKADQELQPLRVRRERHERRPQDRAGRHDDVGNGSGTDFLASQASLTTRFGTGRIMGRQKEL